MKNNHRKPPKIGLYGHGYKWNTSVRLQTWIQKPVTKTGCCLTQSSGSGKESWISKKALKQSQIASPILILSTDSSVFTKPLSYNGKEFILAGF